ncbi:MAG: TonB-dependent receptor, partial [Fermentimonas sp.]|nr:TonB-dependent receptor [Fermentimonas sp.]
IYNNEVNTSEEVSVRAKQKAVSEVLNSILEEKDMNYSMEGNHIIISVIEKSLEMAETPSANIAQQLQRKTITGTVIDAEGTPVIGVNIVETGTTNGTVTDVDGRFILTVDNNAIIRVSYIGYLEQDLNTAERNNFNVVLLEDTQALEEVVVIGYGTVRKKDLTGSVTQVNSENLLRSNSPNISNALQGIIPADVSSVWIPGNAPSIEIRGLSSITGSNAPLWVVDGIPMQSTNVSLNPNDVESIDILKDASASAIYGARGSNGVIIVTTKQAQTGETSIKTSYNGWLGYDKVLRSPELMNSERYIWYKRTAWANNGRDSSDEAIFDVDLREGMSKGTDTDWFNEIWGKTTFSTNHNFTVNASGRRMGTRLSLGYLNQKSLIETAGYQRYTVNFNNVFNLSERVKFTTAILGSYSKNDQFHEQVRHAYYLSPLATPRDENGNLKLYPNSGEALITNPISEAINNENTTYQYGLIGNAALEWKIWDELVYKMSIGTDLTSSDTGEYNGSETRNRAEAGGEYAAGYRSRTRMSNIFDNVLSYNKVISGLHRLNIMGAYNIETYQAKQVYLRTTDMYFDGLYYNLGSAATILDKNTELTEWGIMSFMGRVNYSLLDRYLFTFTYRHDGSSRLSEDNRWAGFPSLSVAWRLSEEPFFQSIRNNYVDNLKIRLSWGNTGNTNVDAYGTLGTLSKTFYSWGESPAIGTIPSGIPNPDLKWEKLEEYNLGIDFGILKSRVSGSIDFYNRTTRDLILSRNLPATSGYTSVTQNIGSTRNKGVELMLTGKIVRTKDLSWDIGITFLKNKNEILDLYGDKKDDVGSGRFIGHPIRVYYQLDYIGTWQEDETTEAAGYGVKPGYPKYRDVNKDGKISLNDDRYIISREPKWTGGLNTTVKYRSFDFSMQMHTRQGVKAQSNAHSPHHSDPGRYNGFNENWWTPENRSNSAPAPYVSTQYTNFGDSDWFIRDCSFIRLSNISLGYNLPQNFVKKIRFERANIYININNPYVWSKYIGQDPSTPNHENYPATTSFQFGVNFNF